MKKLLVSTIAVLSLSVAVQAKAIQPLVVGTTLVVVDCKNNPDNVQQLTNAHGFITCVVPKEKTIITN